MKQDDKRFLGAAGGLLLIISLIIGLAVAYATDFNLREMLAHSHPGKWYPPSH